MSKGCASRKPQKKKEKETKKNRTMACARFQGGKRPVLVQTRVPDRPTKNGPAMLRLPWRSGNVLFWHVEFASRFSMLSLVALHRWLTRSLFLCFASPTIHIIYDSTSLSLCWLLTRILLCWHQIGPVNICYIEAAIISFLSIACVLCLFITPTNRMLLLLLLVVVVGCILAMTNRDSRCNRWAMLGMSTFSLLSSIVIGFRRQAAGAN